MGFFNIGGLTVNCKNFSSIKSLSINRETLIEIE